MAEAALHEHADPLAADVYRAVLWHLREAGIPYLVGGTYALEHHAGLVRSTKDLDLFVRRADWSRISDALAGAGIECELVFSHWLGKAHRNGLVVDMIFAGGNGLVEVDDDWFARGIPSFVVDVPVHLVTAEDMIWSKAFVMERERFDGADVLHIIRRSGATLDWNRLIECFGSHAGVLLAHVILFRFVYPGLREVVPQRVVDDLWRRAAMPDEAPAHLCRGTLVSRGQYLIDVHEWGYLDARELPTGRMTAQQIREWTAAIDRDG
jgi:hypothetical protein